MSVNSVTSDYAASTNYAATASTAATTAKENTDSEKVESSTDATKQKTESYKPDLDKIRQMKADLKNNMLAFKQMVFAQAKNQGQVAGAAEGSSDLTEMLKGIAGMSQEDAQAAISEDGEWGVNATATRILDFAKALSGGDPAKIDLLRDAVNKGFGAASKVWGGELPEISKQTIAKVMEGFDEWAKSANGATQAATQVTA